jgi:hypothetical protein
VKIVPVTLFRRLALFSAFRKPPVTLKVVPKQKKLRKAGMEILCGLRNYL